MPEFKVKLAGLIIGIVTENKNISEKFGQYVILSDAEADFTVSVSCEEISDELKREVNITPTGAEWICILRAIAERLPEYNRFLLHGAAVSYKNEAFIFTARSGTGKTTHIAIWKKLFGDKVDIINGDKPIIEITESGALVHSSPWAGKEELQNGKTVPLKAICLLQRGESNNIEKADIRSAVMFLLGQVHLPFSESASSKTAELLDRLCKKTEFYSLCCDISRRAAEVSFEALTGDSAKSEEVI